MLISRRRWRPGLMRCTQPAAGCGTANLCMPALAVKQLSAADPVVVAGAALLWQDWHQLRAADVMV